MSNPNNMSSNAVNSGDNLAQTLKHLGSELYIDKNGVPQCKGVRIFDPKKLMSDPVLLKSIKGGMFASEPTLTTWIYFRLINGKIKEITPVTSISILSFKAYNFFNGKFDFIYLKYSTDALHTDIHTAVIKYTNFTPSRITNDVKGLPYYTPEGEALKGDLIYYLVSDKIQSISSNEMSNFGSRQGWWMTRQNQFKFEPEYQCIPEVESNLPVPLQHRESSRTGKKRTEEVDKSWLKVFNSSAKLILLLFNLVSLLLTFFVAEGIFPDIILILKPTENISPVLFMSILNNVNYSTFNKVPSIGPTITILKNAISWVNDGIIVVNDIYSADQYKKAEPGYDLILNDLQGSSDGEDKVNHIIALISRYADIHLPPDRCCIFNSTGQIEKYIPLVYITACRQINDALINKIESDYESFDKTFKAALNYYKSNVPKSIPKSKKNIYIMLLTTLYTYNKLFTPLFPQDLLKEIEEWLCKQEQDWHSLDDTICSDYGLKINKRIAENYFNYSLRVKHGATPFDEGMHTIIIDLENRYFFVEPEENFTIVRDDMSSINDTDKLTTALFNEKYLHPNEHNSKCFRIRTIDSNGISHTTRMHAISLDIISPENQKRFNLIGKDEFLFRYDEIPNEYFLPLVKTVDGRFAGKMLVYEEEESNFYLGTGRTGSGKSWDITQIMPMLQMMGHSVVAFDVSGSYTRKKILDRKMLPEEVVDHLFRFINVGEKSDNIPVDPLDFKDCSSIDDIRVNLQYIIRSCVGKLKENQEKELDAFIYNYLEDINIEEFDIFDMCDKLLDQRAMLKHMGEKIGPIIYRIKKIGFDKQTWKELFSENKVIIINLGNEVGVKTHQLLDILVGSVFRWQIVNDTHFLSIIVDELMDQNLSKNSPLNTIICEGRKSHTALFGAKQDYFNQGSSYDDVLKQANIKSYCRPGKSEDRVAKMLGFSNAITAGFNSFRAGDVIKEGYFYNKELNENTANVIKGRVVDFIETPFYEKFKEKYLKPPKHFYGSIHE